MDRKEARQFLKQKVLLELEWEYDLPGVNKEKPHDLSVEDRVSSLFKPFYVVPATVLGAMEEGLGVRYRLDRYKSPATDRGPAHEAVIPYDRIRKVTRLEKKDPKDS